MLRRVTPSSVLSDLEAGGVVAVLRANDPSRLPAIVEALVEAGVGAAEVTMTVPGAVECIRALASQVPAGFLLGAGTVTDADTVARVVDAGARFVVSPVLRLDVLQAASARNVLGVPGCFSPTEVLTAWEAGARLIKVFPATALGPGYLKDLRGPFPEIVLMPTGGVTPDNVEAWIAAGARVVGVGTALVDPKAVAEGRYDVVVEKGRRLMESVRRARRQT